MSFHLREEPTLAGEAEALVYPVGEPASFVEFLSATTQRGPVVMRIDITVVVATITLTRAATTPAGVGLTSVELILTPWLPVLFGYGEPMAAVLVAFNVVVGAFAYKVSVARGEA